MEGEAGEELFQNLKFLKTQSLNMLLPAIFALILLIIVVFIGLRILGNFVTGLAMVVLVMMASFILAGSLPDLQALPIIGQYVPSLPSATEAIGVIKNVFYNLDILGTSRDAGDNLIVIVANTGKLDISGLNVSVDNQIVQVINPVNYPLKSKQVAALQTNWHEGFSGIVVSGEKARATYP